MSPSQLRPSASPSWSRLFAIGCLAAAVVAACASGAPLAAQAPAPMITQAVDSTQLAPLAGDLRPEATPAHDRGRVSDGMPLDQMLLALRRSPARRQALADYLRAVATPGSPAYRHWLSAAEFRQKFGPAPEDVARIEDWLASQGFTVDGLDAGGLAIVFSGTAGEVHAAFHTEIHHLWVRGKRHFANMSEPLVPAALAPAITGIVSLNDFRPHPMSHPRAAFTFAGGAEQAVVPADLATIYDLNPLFALGATGRGQTIAVIENSDLFSAADWTTFRSTFGLTPYGGTLRTIHPNLRELQDCADPGVVPGVDAEVALDAEWAGASAPGARIEVASCADTQTTFGGLIAMDNLLARRRPPDAMSLSFGACEAGLGAAANAMYRRIYELAEAEGVSVFVAAGDWGAATCDAGATAATHGINVNGLASTPADVAVGGTDFGDTFAGTNATYWSPTNGPTFGSALSYVPEIPWDDSCANSLISEFVTGSPFAFGSGGFCNSALGEQFFLAVVGGGGGPSACAHGRAAVAGEVSGSCRGYRKPFWQRRFAATPRDRVRDLPDVSLFAANGLWGHFYITCWSDLANGGSPCTGSPSGWFGAGGTSFAAPIMAGIQATVNGLNGGRQGNPNPVFYLLAALQNRFGSPGRCNASLGNQVASDCIFHDVTLGDMAVNCTGAVDCYLPSGTNGVLSTSSQTFNPAFAADTGWDYATGLGSVDAFHLALAWRFAARRDRQRR